MSVVIFFIIFVCFQAPHNLMDCDIVAGNQVVTEYFRTETDNTLDRCNIFMQRSPARDRTLNTFNVR